MSGFKSTCPVKKPKLHPAAFLELLWAAPSEDERHCLSPDHNFIATSYRVPFLVPGHWMFKNWNYEIVNPGIIGSQHRWNCFNIKTRSAHFLCTKMNWWVGTLQALSPLCFRAFLKGHFLCRKFNRCDSLDTKEHIHEGKEDWMGTGAPAGARAASFQWKQMSFTLMWLVKYFIVLSYVKFMFFMLCCDLEAKLLWGSWSLNVFTLHAKDFFLHSVPPFTASYRSSEIPSSPPYLQHTYVGKKQKLSPSSQTNPHKS